MFQVPLVSALSAGDTKIAWQNAKVATKNAQALHRQAKLDYAADKTPENEKKVVDTAKDSLGKALDEAEAWLVWKKIDAQENPLAPQSVKDSIKTDADKNIAKIDDLREEVDGIDTQIEAVVVFLKMIVAYVELLTDVARNVGALWVHIGNDLLDEANKYEASLRDTASKMSDNSAILAKLDIAKSELSKARNNVDNSEAAYKQVKLPGNPFAKFNEGNLLLNAAKTELGLAQRELLGAYNLIITSK